MVVGVLAFAAGLLAAPALASGQKAMEVVKLGPPVGSTELVLVTTKGRSLYSLSAERTGKFACTGACTNRWHPLVVSPGTSQIGPVELGTTKRPNGQTQVTFKGHPLYSFTGDTARNRTAGRGRHGGSGGIWRLATISAGSVGRVGPSPSSEAAAVSDWVASPDSASKTRPPENPDPENSILVLGVGWKTGNPATSAPLASDGPAIYTNYLNGHVDEWFRLSSHGLFHNWEAWPGGAYTIEPPAFESLSDPDSCNPGVFSGEVAERAEAHARAEGINPDLFGRVVVEWGTEGHFCTALGIAGRRIVLGNLGFVPMHELGHSLGLPHAKSIQCRDPNGDIVPLSNSCVSTEYGDSYDLMGNGFGTYNAVYAHALGWLQGEFIDASAGEYTHSWTLEPYTASSPGNRALRLIDGSTTLWLEYRQPIGADAPDFSGWISSLVPGLVIHREVAGVSQLLDMTPQATKLDAGLPVGQTWADPLGTMKITLNAADSSSATVTIATQHIQVPNLRGDTIEQAASALSAAGLTLSGWETFKDSFCEAIGVVKSQNPAPGTYLAAGAPVRVTIGEEDPKHLCP
jgi:predicted lipoprotein with Yx(FWY)xxD motif